MPPCHEDVLHAAQSLVEARGVNQFEPNEVVLYLIGKGTPYAESTIRVHIISRCCRNAPPNHEVRYKYFERIGHGLYSII
jgi:hypothetical protein